jgi:Zn-dependent protease with chaperone function
VKLLLLVAAGLGAAFVTYVGNGFGLRSWRSGKDLHWTERARRLHPARTAAKNNLWVLPICICLALELLCPTSAPHWAFTALVAALCTNLATLPMDHEVYPRVSQRDFWRQAVQSWITRSLMWSCFLLAIALMPEQFNLTCLGITVALIGVLVWFELHGAIYLGRKLGVLIAPPERLRGIVADTAARMHVPYQAVWLMRSSFAQAYALPSRRHLFFSERLLEILSDAEIAAIGSHELAHLTESRGDYAMRYVSYLAFLPWIFLTPTLHGLGLLGFFLLLGITFGVIVLFKKISHRLEVRADKIAHTSETDPGTYARALARLYEDNLIPAVNATQRATHPHLYDRLLAAGVTPDYPRPEPPENLSWYGKIASGLVGALAALVIMRSFLN